MWEGLAGAGHEKEVGQESPRPDLRSLLLRGLLWESLEDWFLVWVPVSVRMSLPKWTERWGGGVGLQQLPARTAPATYLGPTGQRTRPASSSVAGPAWAPWCRGTGAPPPGCLEWPPPQGSGPPEGCGVWSGLGPSSEPGAARGVPPGTHLTVRGIRPVRLARRQLLRLRVTELRGLRGVGQAGLGARESSGSRALSRLPD